MTRRHMVVSRADSGGVLKWLLTSGLLATLVAIWGTLLGLLYRIGWLDAFEVSADLFMPASATELTYWAYLAALHIWSALERNLFSALLSVYGIALLIAVPVALFVFSPTLFVRVRLVFSELPWLRAVAAIGFLAVIAIALPLLIVGLTALVAGLPLPGYFSGKAAAESALRKHVQAIEKGKPKCHHLAGPKGPIGACPMVIAQTKERVAYIDEGKVFVVSAEGVQISWSIRTPN